MNSELKRRVILTLLLLAVSRLVLYLPIPGIDYAALIQFVESGSPESTFLGQNAMRGTIGALGIFPYLVASTITVLFFYFRRFRHHVDDRGFPMEFYTLIVTAIIALLQGYGVAVFLESLTPFGYYGNIPIVESGWSFHLLTVLSVTAGTFLFVWLATMITKHGIGNGVCLFILANMFLPMLDGWLDSFIRIDPQGLDTLMNLIMLALFTVAFVAIVMSLMHARWRFSLQQSNESHHTPVDFSLHLNSVGTAGFHVAQAALYFIIVAVTVISMFLPDRVIQEFPPYFLSGIESPFYWIIVGSATFLATYWLASLAYDPRGLQRVLDDYNKTSRGAALFIEKKAFDRKLGIVTLPLAVAIPFVYIAYILFSSRALNYSFFGLPVISFFAITAIALDTHRQFKQHKNMAPVPQESSGEVTCENCKHAVGDDDSYCHYCGILFEEDVKCQEHAEVHAEAICVICGKRLCADCCFETNKRFVCEEHSDVEILQGWATVASARTTIEAELHKQRLGEIPAMVYSNTIAPVYGTLGLYGMHPVPPLFAYRELGGGSIRVMVPIGEWLKAREHFDEALAETQSPEE